MTCNETRRIQRIIRAQSMQHSLPQSKRGYHTPTDTVQAINFRAAYAVLATEDTQHCIPFPRCASHLASALLLPRALAHSPRSPSLTPRALPRIRALPCIRALPSPALTPRSLPRARAHSFLRAQAPKISRVCPPAKVPQPK